MYEQAREWLLWANPPPNLDRAFAIIKEENNNKELVSFKTIEGRDATSKILLLLWQSLLTIKNLRKISSFDLTTIINRGTHGPHGKSQNLKQLGNQGGFQPTRQAKQIKP